MNAMHFLTADSTWNHTRALSLGLLWKKGLSLLWVGLHILRPRLRRFRLLWSCQQVTQSFPSHGFDSTVKSLQVRGLRAAGYIELGVHVLPYQTQWTEVGKAIYPLHYTLIQVCYITSSYQKDVYSESMCALRNRVLSVVLLLLFKDKLTTKLLWQPGMQTLQTMKG